ncbi:putative bifunctional diguanylate cyclase/phosphodiesterase [Reinekea blandensis]|uniref:Predicted signal transduction protein containing a membrane domain, an EAL and a GGDEF domain n=1 Tax=Reinekea blandensis MED297 TaxID=314283 RepID=A4BC19_9GAMM|nr:EAL domain-containing protein [Reinekea blandensis]EAR10504.1 predicted signal transduction protein containing a membrane domain, an EAL and a GGDEF domain [Reinekea sp. MED297] [Reinekea blandensis MED297]
MKLQTRFMMNLSFVGLLAMVTFGFLIESQLAKLLDKEINSQLTSHQSLSTAYLSDTITNIQTDLDLITNNALTRQYFSASETIRYQLFHSELTRVLQRYLKYGEHYGEIAVVLPDGFKEITAFNGKVPFRDIDDTFIRLQEHDELNASEVTFATGRTPSGEYLISAYSPLREYSDLIQTNDNPTLAYIKITLPLKALLNSLSTDNIAVSLRIPTPPGSNTRWITVADSSFTEKEKQAFRFLESDINDQFRLRSSLDPELYTSNTSQFYRLSLIIMLLALFSLIVVTYLLLRKVILKPLDQFSELVDQSDLNADMHPALTAYDQNEFGQLKEKFHGMLSRLKQHSSDLKRQAFTDTLTGLPNRAALYELLAKRTVNPSQPLSVLFLDLDGFKNVNDIYGHDLGDTLLKAVSQKLLSIVRDDPNLPLDSINIRNDAVFRLGGDEFTVVLMANSHAALVAQRIIDAFQNGIQIHDKLLYTGTSIGISEFPKDAIDPSLLIQYADMAMYQAKQEGKMRYSIFTSDLAEEEQRRLKLEQLVREGVEFGRFETHFQPKIQASTGKLIGFEALARLRDVDQQLIPPGIFIPVAQEKGVLEYITYRVCEQACQLLQESNNPELIASINIAPNQLSDLRLIADIRSIMWRYQITPRQIEFEVTEEELISNFRQTQRDLELIRNFGFKTALDDFGSGYSSLGQLKKFQFDTLKLDRVFVSTDDFDTESSIGVLSSIKELADRLKMTVVAEGIETASQLAFIQSFNIDIIQGYFYSRPISGPQFSARYLNKPNSLPDMSSSSLKL